MTILIMPTLERVQEDLGYEPWEDVDLDSLLLEQGNDGYLIEVEDGESFEIPKNTIGKIQDDFDYYQKIEIIEDVFDEEIIEGPLRSGMYRLEGCNIIEEQGFEY
jgi:hypothetical protein